jgi:enoyl-CoA hydratase/carnithine racemase
MTDLSDIVFISHADGIARVTLNRPRILNAIDRNVRVTLARAFRTLSADDSIAVVILKGAGRAFSAGQDQAESARMTAADAAQRIEDYADLYRAIRHTQKPVIAQVHGYAVGAGLQLALLADVAFLARTAQISMPELERGSASITGSGLMWPLIGERAMKRLVLGGDRITADEAARLGLVYDVIDDERLEDTIEAFAARIAARPRTGTAVTKDWWNRLSEEIFERTLAHAREAHAQNFRSGDFSRAAQEFMQRKATA